MKKKLLSSWRIPAIMLFVLPSIVQAQQANELKYMPVTDLTVNRFYNEMHQVYKSAEIYPLVDFDLNGITCSSGSRPSWQNRIA